MAKARRLAKGTLRKKWLASAVAHRSLGDVLVTSDDADMHVAALIQFLIADTYLVCVEGLDKLR